MEAAAAALQTAKVNLGFTQLISPIDGIAGVAQTQVGNLVGPSSNAVTTVSTLDPIKANFTVSEQEYLSFTRNDTAMEHLQLELILADGSTYAHKGKFSFADREVNPATGAIQLTGLFPNPGNALRPGQYGRVRAVIGTDSDALLVPQRCVTELQGTYQAAVVDSHNTVRIETVQVGDRIGSQWIVRGGLKPGERVVAEGVLKVRPGMQVNPVPFTAAEKGEATNVQVLHQSTDRRHGDLDSVGHHGRGHHRDTADLAVSQHRSAGGADSGQLCRRRRADRRAVGGHAHRTADERRRQSELHVLAERGATAR